MRMWDKYQLRRPRQIVQRTRRTRLKKSERRMGKGRQPWMSVVTERLVRVSRPEIMT
jgi:hypothetical protein